MWSKVACCSFSLSFSKHHWFAITDLFFSLPLSVCRMPSLWRRGGSSCRATFARWWTNWSRHCPSSQPAPPKRPCCLCCLSVCKWTHTGVFDIQHLRLCVSMCACVWEAQTEDANTCVQVQDSSLWENDARLQRFEWRSPKGNSQGTRGEKSGIVLVHSKLKYLESSLFMSLKEFSAAFYHCRNPFLCSHNI